MKNRFPPISFLIVTFCEQQKSKYATQMDVNDEELRYLHYDMAFLCVTSIIIKKHIKSPHVSR